jgi:hypothetical protein
MALAKIDANALTEWFRQSYGRHRAGLPYLGLCGSETKYDCSGAVRRARIHFA